jgi:hypothetical protein
VNANGNAAFYGLLAGGGIVGSAACVATVTGTSYPTVVAQTGTPAPDATGLSTSGTFTKLSDPVFNNNDHVAFIGTLKTSGTNITSKDDTGIWSDFDGTMKLIVQEGQTEPGGSGGKFSKFNQIVLPDVGGVVFQATLTGVPSSANQGVWAMTAGGLKRVVIAGQQLPYRNATQETVKKIAIFQQAANVLGQSRSFDATTQNLVYQATFTGPGSLWGVYKVTFP